jgi:hypothetical protein
MRSIASGGAGTVSSGGGVGVRITHVSGLTLMTNHYMPADFTKSHQCDDFYLCYRSSIGLRVTDSNDMSLILKTRSALIH